MDEFVPTTQQVEDGYCALGPVQQLGERREGFRIWLANMQAQCRAEGAAAVRAELTESLKKRPAAEPNSMSAVPFDLVLAWAYMRERTSEGVSEEQARQEWAEYITRTREADSKSMVSGS